MTVSFALIREHYTFRSTSGGMVSSFSFFDKGSPHFDMDITSTIALYIIFYFTLVLSPSWLSKSVSLLLIHSFLWSSCPPFPNLWRCMPILFLANIRRLRQSNIQESVVIYRDVAT